MNDVDRNDMRLALAELRAGDPEAMMGLCEEHTGPLANLGWDLLLATGILLLEETPATVGLYEDCLSDLVEVLK